MTYYYVASEAAETAAVLMLECRSISFRAQWIQQQRRQSHFSARSPCVPLACYRYIKKSLAINIPADNSNASEDLGL